MIIRVLANFIFDITEPENGQTTGATLFLTNKISFFRAALVQNILARETFLIIEKKSFFKSLLFAIFKIKIIELTKLLKATKIPNTDLIFIPSSQISLNILSQISDVYARTEITAIQGILIKKENTWPKVRKLRISFTKKEQKSINSSEAKGKIDSLLTELFCRCDYSEKSLISYLIKKAKSRKIFLKIIKDATGAEDSYFSLFIKIILLSKLTKNLIKSEQRVGVLLPNTNISATMFFSLQLLSVTPCMLNYTSGLAKLRDCLRLARIKIIITSEKFVEKADLNQQINDLNIDYHIIYLEELSKKVNSFLKIESFFNFIKLMVAPKFTTENTTTQEACILFTTGSEGAPKGVPLTQSNLIANYCQTQHMLENQTKDKVLNVLPFFHSFGLMAGLILPILKGTRIFQYPNPLHYKEIVKVCREEQISILWGTPTFLKGYAEYAKKEDFKWLNFVVSGAEKLPQDIRELWINKFDITILEGYGATEASPVISVNTKFSNKKGTVGRIVPLIDFALRPVNGIEEGKELLVKGPNIMKGYLDSTEPAKLNSTNSEVVITENASYSEDNGWYETGDLVKIDKFGYLTILGRIKRFAKLGGEMVSLSEVETVATKIWPSDHHAAISMTINSLEAIILFTTKRDPERKKILNFVKQNNLSNLVVPKMIEFIEKIPIFGSGKIDYQQLVEEIRARHDD